MFFWFVRPRDENNGSLLDKTWVNREPDDTKSHCWTQRFVRTAK